MTGSAFDSAWLKWGRAVVHAESLKADFDLASVDADRNPGMTIECEYDADKHGFWPVITYIDPQSALWGVLLGDIVHNYRCCLDHVAWAAMQIGCTKSNLVLTEKQQGAIQFPICDERDDFNGWIKGRLFALSRAHVAAMRRYQPYHRGKRTRALHVLRMLNTLSNEDKHREINLLDFIPSKGQFRVTKAVDCTVREFQIRKAEAVPFHVGAKLGLIAARKARKKDAQPHIEVEYEFFARPSLYNRITVIDWLNHTRSYIAQMLLEFGDPPAKGLAELGTAVPPIDWSGTAQRSRPPWART